LYDIKSSVLNVIRTEQGGYCSD